jgi:hypothetical protein
MLAIEKPKLKPSLNKKGECNALYLDYRTGAWVETIPQYLLDMIEIRYKARGAGPLRVISLGWGVQSTRLTFGAALGEIEADFAVHSDTTYETEFTYQYAAKWVDWCLDRGFPVITVKDPVATSDPLNINKPSLHIPAYNISLKPGKLGKNKKGKLHRTCTGRWKIDVARRTITAVMLYLKIKKFPGAIQQILGISKDEWTRATDSRDKFIINVYPLLRQDRNLIGVSSKLLPKTESRQDCINWFKANGFPAPTKSACYHCVFHSQAVWIDMKRENGSDWKNAVAFDLAIRGKSTKYGGLFIHRSAKPLDEAVKLPEELGYSQGSMFEFTDDDTKCKDAGYCEFVPSR